MLLNLRRLGLRPCTSRRVHKAVKTKVQSYFRLLLTGPSCHATKGYPPAQRVHTALWRVRRVSVTKDWACIMNAYTVWPGGANTNTLLVCESVSDFRCKGLAQMSGEFMFGCGKVTVDKAWACGHVIAKKAWGVDHVPTSLVHMTVRTIGLVFNSF